MAVALAYVCIPLKELGAGGMVAAVVVEVRDLLAVQVVVVGRLMEDQRSIRVRVIRGLLVLPPLVVQGARLDQTPVDLGLLVALVAQWAGAAQQVQVVDLLQQDPPQTFLYGATQVVVGVQPVTILLGTHL